MQGGCYPKGVESLCRPGRLSGIGGCRGRRDRLPGLHLKGAGGGGGCTGRGGGGQVQNGWTAPPTRP